MSATSPEAGAVQEDPAAGSTLSAGVTAAIVVAALAAVCFAIFCIVQLLIWRRRRRLQRARVAVRYSSPQEDPEGAQLTSVKKFNGFTFINPVMEAEDKDYSGNTLSYVGLKKLMDHQEEIHEEFLMLPTFLPKFSTLPPRCEVKNRYSTVIPEPSTRVSLSLAPGDETAGYINANFVTGYHDEPVSYIATQAPMRRTVDDFWRMMWEQGSEVIVMLTELEELGVAKCEEYWPIPTDGDDTLRIYGDFEVRLVDMEVQQYWTYSKLVLRHVSDEAEREVHHFWYTAWPPEGLPPRPSTVLDFLLQVRDFHDDTSGPVTVHCSPGTGRTGAVIAIDICMHEFDESSTVDILRTVRNLRRDRAGAVETREQYTFIYKAMYEYARRRCSPATSTSSSVNA